LTDLQSRYLDRSWGSPQWDGVCGVAVHESPSNPQQRLDGTLNAWIMLYTFYGLFTSGNRTNMSGMLQGNQVTQTWVGLNESDLRDRTADAFRLTSSAPLSDDATAIAALCLFLLGIVPQSGRGLAIPLSSERHSDYSSLDYRHFGFDYANRSINIPVWGGTTLRFAYGGAAVYVFFDATGIYRITFSSGWDSISQVKRVSDLYSNECYLWSQES